MMTTIAACFGKIVGRALMVGFAATATIAHAALIHAYDFSTAGAVNDTVGTSNGTLLGGATVSGGALHLDGAGGYVQFSDYLVPTGSSAYSVSITASSTPSPSTYTEIVSQGYSGGGGFYIGTAPGGVVRLTDHFTATGYSFPSGQHTFLLTSGAGGTSFYVDNQTIFTSPTQATAVAGGTTTRLGRQFDPYTEYFAGNISSVRIYDSVIVPGVPEPAAWSLLITGFGFTGAALRRRGLAGA